jgi:predicted RNA-binding protein with RPS1 domain
VADLEVGKEYEGAIVSIRDFGAFVNIGVNTDGLLHISQVRDAAPSLDRCPLLRPMSRAAPPGTDLLPTHAASCLPASLTSPPATLVANPCRSLPPHSPDVSPCNPQPQISTGFVHNVSDVVSVAQDVRVRVINIDQERGKFAVTMIPEDGAAPAPDADLESGERPQLKQQARAAKQQKRSARPAAPVSAGDVIKGKVVGSAAFGVFVEVRRA